VKAFVLLTVTPGKVDEVVGKARELPGVVEAYSVAGRVDVVVKVEAADLKELKERVVGGLQKLPGVKKTETLIVVE